MIYSVSDYLVLLNTILREQATTQELFIEGEISDYRVSQGKWISFDLKDEKAEAVLKCWGTVWQIKEPIENGMRVHVSGFPKIFERYGTLKLTVEHVVPVGEGALRRSYELLKKKLEQEGLFDLGRKRSLPRFPKKIGLITSKDAAAYGDFLRVLNNRWGGIEIEHMHVHVQGREAVPEILAAFRFVNQLPLEHRPDVLVLTRGGGGLEDLHAFNDEEVTRAVYQSVVPVVVAVGHERDESLCDFVADVRASTPSNAAERLVPSRSEILYEIETMEQHLERRLQERIDVYKRLCDRVAQEVHRVLDREREKVQMLTLQFRTKVDDWIPSIHNHITTAMKILRQVDPTRVLARGYAIARLRGHVITSAESLAIGEEIAIQFTRGQIDTQILRINGKGKQKFL